MPSNTDEPFHDDGNGVPPPLLSQNFASTTRNQEIARRQLGDRGDVTVTAAIPLWIGLVSDHVELGSGLAGYIRSSQSIAVAIAESGSNFDEIVLNGERFLFDRSNVETEEEEAWYQIAVELVTVIAASDKVVVSISTDATNLGSDSFLASFRMALCSVLNDYRQRESGTYEFGSVRNLTTVSSHSHLDDQRIKICAADPDAGYAFARSGSEDVRSASPVQDAAVCWIVIELRDSALYRKDRVLSLTRKIEHKLRSKGFGDISKGSAFERSEMQIAIDALPRRLRPWGRFLLSEGHLSEKYFEAIQQSDWQLLGGLIQFSGQTQIDSGEFDPKPIEILTDGFEASFPDSLYGARYTDLGNSVLLLMNNISEPDVLNLVRIAFKTELAYCPEMIMLPN